jgi:CheY-like chemotaxis protein
LAFSRQQPVEPKVVDLNEIILDSQRMLRRVIGEDVNLRFVPGKAIGSVLIDPGQVEQILVNLSVNARDSMIHGGRLTIETSMAVLRADDCARHPGMEPGEYVTLAVTDTGSGMTDEVKAHIFEPFFSTKPRGKGTGLGLATVFGVVKQNKGGIEVHSAPGVGSTFKVYLPRVAAKAEPLVRSSQETMPRGTEAIFLVEDEALVRALAVRLLTRLGYRVTAFPNGGEALKALQKLDEPLHLLFTDVVLPDMNGRELAESVQALRHGTRVLFSSGYTDNIIAHHGVLEAGIDFIGKPYAPLDLAKKVRAVLDRDRR